MDQLFVGLILAAVTSAAIFAYRHPIAFERVSNPTILILAAVVLIVGFWNMAHYSALQAAAGAIPFTHELRNVVAASIEEKMASQSFFGVVAAVIVYLLLLQVLPLLKKLDEEPAKPRVKSKKNG